MARSTEQRVTDALAALSSQANVWVGTASQEAIPHMVPFSLHWDGEHIIICTDPASATVKNLVSSPNAKLSIGDSNDVVLVTAELVGVVGVLESSEQLVEEFAARTGWNPKRETADMVFVALKPTKVHAWLDVSEIDGRNIMRNGAWLN